MTLLDGNWRLDPTHSTVGFTVRHAGISKVRGQFSEVESTSQAERPGRFTVEASAKAASFESGNADRDAHVKSADFLDVDQYPLVTFKGVFEDEELVGDLTIHGVTKPVSFEAELSEAVKDPFGLTRIGVEASTTINRREFGLTWNAALEAGGVLVSDKVKIELDLAFVKED